MPVCIRNRRFAVFIFVAITALVLAACGGLTRGEEPTPTQISVPTSPPDNGGNVDDGSSGISADQELGERITLTGTGVKQLDGFTATYSIQFFGEDDAGELVSLTISGELAGRRDPLISQLTTTFSSEGTEMGIDTSGELTYTIIGELAYLEVSTEDSPECIGFPVELTEMVPFGQLTIEADDFLDETSVDLELIDDDAEANGEVAYYYRGENVSSEGFTDATVEAWIDPEKKLLLKLEIQDQGDIENMGNGTLTVSYDLLNSNLPYNIVPPEDCIAFSER